MSSFFFFFFFFFNDTATTEIYTLSLHDALPISISPSLLPVAWGNLHSPIPLRYPEKFAVSLSLALAVLAGLAFDAFRRGRKARWTLWAGAVLAVLGGVAALLPGPSGRLAARVIGAEAGLAVTAGRVLPG